MKLSGKRAIITGSSRGFGYAVARAFVKEGARVMLCARDADRLTAAVSELRLETDASEIFGTQCDVSNSAQVKNLLERTIDVLGGLDILVSSAGVYGPMGPVEELDWEAWTQAISINLYGTVLPCRAVVSHFKKQKAGTIILLSGGGATKPMANFSAYAASKAAVARFGETLAEETRADGVSVNLVAPGALNTRLLEELIAAGAHRVGQGVYEQALKQQAQGGTPLERGAALCVFLASDAASGITGKLISAVWDPWCTLPDHLEELTGSDIYTLRRIVPEDRGVRWD